MSFVSQTIRKLDADEISVTSLGNFEIPADELTELRMLTLPGLLGRISNVQSIYCNASDAIHPVTIINPITQQEVVFPAGTIGWLNFLVSVEAAQLQVYCESACTVFLEVTSSIVSQYLIDSGLMNGSPIVRRVDVTAIGTAVTLLDENTRRTNYTLWNDGTATLYVLHGPGVVSSSNFSYRLLGQGYYELNPQRFGGIVTGIWSAVSGGARLSEYE